MIRTQNSFNILPRVKSSAVERLIPPSRIPTLPKHTGPTPSGWISRVHDILIYTDVTNSNRKLTLIWKGEGGIWALEKDGPKTFITGEIHKSLHSH
uniref:Uncharacterized protein n=1 Tax=Oreochromis niloticus TaxID=8128 RepID=A0A669C5R3_ORENI